MRSAISSSTALCDACQSLIDDHADFWLVAGVTDASFETACSKNFILALNTLEESAISPQLLAELRLGINGNLASIMGRHCAVRANLGRGQTRPDLCFTMPGAGVETIVEIKLAFDLTMPQFYGHKGHGMADDRDKLVTLRTEGFPGELYQIVFFLALPNYHYPAGEWYGPTWKLCRRRDSYPGCRGIVAQYQELRKYLSEPTFPATEPAVTTLRAMRPETAKTLDEWYSRIFRPADAGWTFDSRVECFDAKVGFALWSY